MFIKCFLNIQCVCPYRFKDQLWSTDKFSYIHRESFRSGRQKTYKVNMCFTPWLRGAAKRGQGLETEVGRAKGGLGYRQSIPRPLCVPSEESESHGCLEKGVSWQRAQREQRSCALSSQASVRMPVRHGDANQAWWCLLLIPSLRG